MADKTLIAWTDHTFNPWIGCHKVSQGCTHCYAETLVTGRMGRKGTWGANGVRQRTQASGPWRNVEKWNAAAEKAGKPAMVFCASLADVFEDYPGPNEWRADVFELIRRLPVARLPAADEAAGEHRPDAARRLERGELPERVARHEHRGPAGR